MVSLQVLSPYVINIHIKLPVSLNNFFFTDSIKFSAEKFQYLFYSVLSKPHRLKSLNVTFYAISCLVRDKLSEK